MHQRRRREHALLATPQRADCQSKEERTTQLVTAPPRNFDRKCYVHSFSSCRGARIGEEDMAHYTVRSPVDRS